MKTFFLTLALLSAATIASAKNDEPSFTVSGTMMHSNLEGGCWYLNATNGQNYELIGDTVLINRLHEQGMQVNLLVRRATGHASICMIGTIVEVLEQVKTVRYPYDPAVGNMQLTGTMHTKSGVWYVVTKEGAKFEFKEMPAAKYRHINAKIDTVMRVLLDKNSTKLHLQGLILPESKRPIDPASKNIPKHYDSR